MFRKLLQRQRIIFEDALKHIHNCEYRKVNATLQSLSGFLGFSIKKTISLINKLEANGFVYLTGNGLHLTVHGKALALQIIRAHRLWESYLSDEKGLPLKVVHVQAEKKEHHITPSQADALEAQLGYPTRDPHGDPIPSGDYHLKRGKSIALLDWPVDKLGRIVHIEDEPQTIFEQILAEGLLLDTFVKVIESNEKGLHLWTYLHECWIAPVVAANIFVDDAPQWIEETDVEPLSALKPSECGKVVTLSCQGLMRRRFLDLGIVPGTLIETMIPSALAEPLAYKIRETLIALRKEQTDKIFIQRIENPSLAKNAKKQL